MIVKYGEDCEHYEECKEIYEMKLTNKQKLIKLILYSIFAIILYIAFNLAVFIVPIPELFTVTIVADILTGAFLIGFPIQSFIKGYFQSQNGGT